MRNQSTSPRRFLARAGVLVAVAMGLAAVYSCSLIVETASTQCQTDADCVNIMGYPKCNATMGVCVTSTTTSSSSGSMSSSSGAPPSCDVDGGIDGGGCYDTSLAMCTTNLDNSELLNGCTTGCIAFDNGALMGFVDAGYALPDLPTVGPDGGM